MLEFAKRELEIKFDGEVHKLNYPTVLQMKKFAKQGDSNDIDYTLEFLESLGLKKEISEQLEVGQLEQVVKALTEKKK